jgi:hypothetical protein
MQTKTQTVPVLGDPHGMRKADHWLDVRPQIGEYHLSTGRTVWVTWLPTSQTHTHIVVYDAEQTWVIENVVRVQAARETDRLLAQIEAQP